MHNILELLLLGSKVSLDQLSSDSVSCWICDPRRPLCEQAVGPTLTFALEDGMNLTLTAKVSWHRLAVVSSFLLCLFFHVLSTSVKHQTVILHQLPMFGSFTLVELQLGLGIGTTIFFYKKTHFKMCLSHAGRSTFAMPARSILLWKVKIA